MSTNKIPPVVTKDKPVPPEGIVVNQIKIIATDRSRKDIETWRSAHQSAESVAYANRTRLLDLYDDVVLDGHLSGIMEKRISSVLNKTLFYTVNGKKVDEMDAVIKSDAFREIIKQKLEAKFYGLGGMEFIPGDKLAFEKIPLKHIKTELGLITEEQSGQTGYEYKKIPNIIVFGCKDNLGLLLKCAPYAIYKRGAIADWGQYIEIFGMPVRIIKYDAHDNQTKIELQTVLDESGGALALMIPRQADFEMLDGKATNADGKLQETFRKAMNEEMSVLVLGNTESTNSSSSSGYAQSKTHGEQQAEIIGSDLTEVVNFLNSDELFTVLKSYALPVATGGKFEFKKEINVEKLKTKIDIDSKVAEKVPVGDDYWYDTYGIPKPDNYDELRAKMDKEKERALQDPAPAPGNKGSKKPGKKNMPSLADESAWFKLRQKIADFFDPALR